MLSTAEGADVGAHPALSLLDVRNHPGHCGSVHASAPHYPRAARLLYTFGPTITYHVATSVLHGCAHRRTPHVVFHFAVCPVTGLYFQCVSGFSNLPQPPRCSS